MTVLKVKWSKIGWRLAAGGGIKPPSPETLGAEHPTVTALTEAGDNLTVEFGFSPDSEHFDWRGTVVVDRTEHDSLKVGALISLNVSV
jgi:hypothetical protein